MNNKDFNVIKEVHESLINEPNSKVEEARIYNPRDEVEKSLTSFLNHRFRKIKDDSDFEEQIKEAILARISEAKITELMGLLEIVQRNSNVAAEKILVPFINQSTQNGGLLDNNKNKSGELEKEGAKLFDSKNSSADVLQGLHQLNQLLETVLPKNEKDQSSP